MSQLGFPIAPIENSGASIDYWHEAKSSFRLTADMTSAHMTSVSVKV
jgi:hypothetical protein